jgi:KUP system potassium uptake protein
MLLLGSTGAYNISAHSAIFRAFDPSRAFMYFVRTGNYDALAGIILALTGAEGAFQDPSCTSEPS